MTIKITQKPKITFKKDKQSILKQKNNLIILENKSNPLINLKATTHKWTIIMSHIQTIETWVKQNGGPLNNVPGFKVRDGFAFVSKGKTSKGFGLQKAKWIIEHKEELLTLI